jgi:hypothetical protein
MLKGIDLEGTGLPLLEVSRVTAITQGKQGRIYLEEMGDGTWRLTYTEKTIPDIKKLTALRLVREENPERAYIEKLKGEIPDGQASPL